MLLQESVLLRQQAEPRSADETKTRRARPDDSRHATCTQSTHQPGHPTQPGRGSDPVQLWRALGDGGRGGERGGGATTAVATT
ncbi:hypothetical protein EYF80_030312 [Liparis tanakae]|uniref:Uncharacterized protein n=1 Tax=Liparis tanakae TaxID=230148 RepID=A0A4Z2H0V3_9TELE|nr:hypothetical protein EYF80_030312 [Liparis tanakae]